MKGKNHWNWKGGITPLIRIIRECSLYYKWRKSIWERDRYTCQICDIQIRNPIAHHIVSFSSIIKKNNIKCKEDGYNCKELWNIDNGITLCKDCHNWIHHQNVSDFQ